MRSVTCHKLHTTSPRGPRGSCVGLSPVYSWAVILLTLALSCPLALGQSRSSSSSDTSSKMECMYLLSPTDNLGALHVWDLKTQSARPLLSLPLRGNGDPEGVSWGLTTDTRSGAVLVVHTNDNMVTSFDPRGSSGSRTSEWVTTWVNQGYEQDRVSQLVADARFRPVWVGVAGANRPMEMAISPNGRLAFTPLSTGPKDLIAVLALRDTDDLNAPLRFPVFVQAPANTPGQAPHTAAEWISETEVVFTRLGSHRLFKYDTATEQVTQWYVPEDQTEFFWSMASDLGANELYLGCAEKGICVDVLDITTRTVVRHVRNPLSGTLLDMQVRGDELWVTGRAIGVRALDKRTFEEVVPPLPLLDTANSIEFAECPVDAFDAFALSNGKASSVIGPVSAAGAIVLVAILAAAVYLRKRSQADARQRQLDQLELAKRGGYQPEASFFSELLKVQSNPVKSSFDSPILDHLACSSDVDDISPSSSSSMKTRSPSGGRYAAAQFTENARRLHGLQHEWDQQAVASLPTVRKKRGQPDHQGGRNNDPGGQGAGGTAVRPYDDGDDDASRAQENFLSMVHSGITIIPAEDIKIRGFAGSGGFADVYLGNWNGIKVAVKCLRDGVSESTAAAFRRELSTLTRLRHPNITLMVGVMPGPRLAMITDFLEGGSLYDLLCKHRAQSRHLPLSQAYTIARDIACGLVYLHSRTPPLVHRDIKSMNILLDSRGRAHLGDFGLCKELLSAGPSMTQAVGTPAWMAPEMFASDSTDSYTTKVDVYAYGVVLYEIITMMVPWEGMSTISTLRTLMMNNDSRPPFPPDTHETWKSFIESVWHTNPEARPTMIQALEFLRQNEDALTTPWPRGSSNDSVVNVNIHDDKSSGSDADAEGESSSKMGSSSDDPPPALGNDGKSAPPSTPSTHAPASQAPPPHRGGSHPVAGVAVPIPPENQV